MGFERRRYEDWKINLNFFFLGLNVDEGDEDEDEEEIEGRWWRKRKKNYMLVVYY